MNDKYLHHHNVRVLYFFVINQRSGSHGNLRTNCHVSLINSDMKILTRLEADRFQSLAGHTLHSSQLVMGSDQSIIQGINEARDCIQAINRNKGGAGIMDLDSERAFDFLIMTWVFMEGYG